MSVTSCRVEYATTRDFPFEVVNGALDRLDASLEEAAERLRARGVRETRVEYGTEARYPSQTWELEVPLPTSRFQSLCASATSAP